MSEELEIEYQDDDYKKLNKKYSKLILKMEEYFDKFIEKGSKMNIDLKKSKQISIDFKKE